MTGRRGWVTLLIGELLAVAAVLAALSHSLLEKDAMRPVAIAVTVAALVGTIAAAYLAWRLRSK